LFAIRQSTGKPVYGFRRIRLAWNRCFEVR
jgi:hypothetical protein